MKPDFRTQRTTQQKARVIFVTLAFLSTLALVTALAGSSSAHTASSASKSQARASSPMTAGRIAFYSVRDGQPAKNSDIYAMNPDGSSVARLTTDAGGDLTPNWSHDGSEIVFSSSRDHPDYSLEIYVMNADGSNQHIIPTGQTNNSVPSWSPDGTKIAFMALPAGASWPDIFVMNSNGSGVNRLTFTTNGCYPNSPSWSPNGSLIAFDMPDCQGGGGAAGIRGGTHSIYVVSAIGGTAHAITSGHADFEPDWSPDGTKIAFSRNDNLGHLELWKMNSGGGGETLVTSGEDIVGKSWSPNGLQIVYGDHLPSTTDRQIFVVNADGSNPHSISGTSISDFGPDWGAITSTTVLVQNEQGTPVPNAQVWRNSQGYSYPGTFVGTTNMSGTVPLPNPTNNEFLVARSLVYTGTTNKGGHDGWAYHVYATNLTEHDNGIQTAYLITDTTQLTHTLVVTTTSPLIGFNIVASVEYNATPASLSVIAQGLSGRDEPPGYYAGASDFLLDVTDGQMFFEQVAIYEEGEHWDDADYQFFADYYRADATRTKRFDNYNALTSTDGHIHVQGSGHYGRPWNQNYGFSTLIHEFSHYAIGAADEYYYHQDGDDATCTLTPDPAYDFRASIMDDQTISSEYCTFDIHNTATHQQVVEGGAVWQTLQANWTDPMNRWRVLRPNDRHFYDPGPNFFASRAAEETVPTINSSVIGACAPIPVTVEDIFGRPVQTATLSLQYNGDVIGEGTTDVNGQRLIYGGVINFSKLTAVDPGGLPFLRVASAEITSCSPFTMTLGTLLAGASSPSSMPNTPWPTHWLTTTADYSQNQVNATLHFVSDPPDQPLLYATQGGINRQQIPLTYDPIQHNYAGSYPFDPARSTDFQFEVGITGTNGLDFLPYRVDAAQYNSDGQYGAGEQQAPQVPLPTTTQVPTNWDIFAPESRTNLSVNPNSLPDGTGVTAGQVLLPAQSPNGLLLVGGPISVQGQNPLSGTVRLSLAFKSEDYCGLQQGSTTIYRYNGTGWDARTTLLNDEWHLAAADITQWGIYAVFAQPNPQVVFSDVPQGSTFYDYINWITCHGVASGYADGTFRPNNNATRGQISKMVANAYRWHLDPPSTGSYTFADVVPGSTFYLYIEAAYREGVVNGYPCGGNGETCDPQHRPYFRPNNNVTRGQIAKIISNAALYTDTPTGQTFQDVVAGSTFYTYTQRIASKGIINGYPCGGAGEPCVPPANRPYFRPNNNATRGQLSKIIYLALQPR